MGFLSTLGNALMSAVKSFVRTLAPKLMECIPPQYLPIAMLVVTVVSAIIGINEKPEELGWQMNEADKKPEDFSSFKEYKEYLDREYPFDQEKFDKLSEEHKNACRYVGLAGTIAELREAKQFEITSEGLGVLAKCAFNLKWNEAQIAAFAKGLTTTFVGFGNNSFSDIGALAKGNLNPVKWDSVTGAISAAAKESGIAQDIPTIIASFQENV